MPKCRRATTGFFGQSATAFESREPLVARLLIELQVESHLLRVQFAPQRPHRLVILHQLGRLHGACVQIIVHLVIAAARHVHTFYQEVVDGLALVADGAVLRHVDAGQPLQHIFYMRVFGRGKVGQVVSDGVAPAIDAPGTYLHLPQHDGLGPQGEVEPPAPVHVARLARVAQQRGADPEDARVVPGQ